MEKVREIVRLKEAGLSDRMIHRALFVSRPVIKEYVEKIQSAGLDYATIRGMTDEALTEVIEGRKSASERYQTLSELFAQVSKELMRRGVTLQHLWQEYRDEHPDGYSYSQFCYHFQLWRSASELTMRIEHKAGDKMFIDFAGKKFEIVDKETSELKEVETFVAVLGASQYTYVEAVATQQKQDVISATQNAFRYFGGVTCAVVPDCMKTAVTRPDKYEPDINPEYTDFSRHFQTVILPARPKRPKDKALVENAVRIVYMWIYAPLRDRIFDGLEELNFAIRQELEKYNTKPMQKLGVSRKMRFEQIEKQALAPLPTQPYVIRRFKSLKVQFNYHIYLSEDKHHYSVPYRYRSKQVTVIYNDSVVEIFYNNQRLVFHKRNRTANGYTTIKEHMPSQHRVMSDWNPERLINWARKLGQYVEVVISHILQRAEHPEQAYKVCLGILNLTRTVEAERLNKACRKVVEFQNYSLKGIKNILKNKLEEQQMDCFERFEPPDHQNIRGSKYYN